MNHKNYYCATHTYPPILIATLVQFPSLLPPLYILATPVLLFKTRTLTLLLLLLFKKTVPLLRTLMLSDSLVQSPCPVSRYFLLFFFPGSPNFSRRSNKISLNSAAFSNSNAREACCISFSKRTIISRASLAFSFAKGVGAA